MKRKATLINQVTGPLFIDIANVYAKEYDSVRLVTGSIEPTTAKLDDRIQIILKCKYKRNKGFQRIYTWILFYLQCFNYLLIRKSHGKILLVTNPPILPWLGILLAKSKHVNFDVLVYDIYPDALANLGFIKEKSRIYEIWKLINKKVYENANRVITISNIMKDVLSESIENSKIEVIYPWVDISLIKPIKKEENWFVNETNLSNKRVILYSGNMGKTHDLMTIMKTAHELNNLTNNFHFLFIGDGAQKSILEGYKENNELNNVTFLPYQDASVMPFSFASADLGIVSLGVGAEGLSVPSKTFYMLASGLAIISISRPNSEVSNLVQENNCGVSIFPSDYLSLAQFLTSLTDADLNMFKRNSLKLSNRFSNENANKFL